MGAVYNQLSIEECRRIERWRHAKVPVWEMARVLSLESGCQRSFGINHEFRILSLSLRFDVLYSLARSCKDRALARNLIE